MEFTPIPSGNDDSAALAQPDFGMLRAWITTRQQSLRTVRALAESRMKPAQEASDPMAANLAILSGNTPAAPAEGRFSHRYAHGAPCTKQGESDA
jgi:hypothetical protein